MATMMCLLTPTQLSPGTAVGWDTGDIYDIKTMLDDTSINVADYWAIGQFREETSSSVLGSTSQKWVLTDFNGTTSGGTAYNAIMHTLALYPTSAMMNSTNTNIGGWSSSAMMTSTMSSIYNSLNSSFKSLIKTVNNISGNGNAKDTTQTTSDQMWLFSEREVQGAKTYSGQQEYNACKQFKYFETSSNRRKTGNSGTYPGNWWLRSPRVSSSNPFCSVNTDGSASATSASIDCGVCAAAAI